MNKQLKEKPQTLDLRDSLKVLISSELNRLPELLEGLEGKDRLAAIIRLMPLVIPKTKSVRHDANEDDGWG